jgi:hypothetical protein
MITAEELRELLRYDPTSGLLCRRHPAPWRIREIRMTNRNRRLVPMPTTKAASRHRWPYFALLLAIVIGGIAVASYYLGNFILVIAAIVILVRCWLAACDRWSCLGGLPSAS